MAPFSRSQHLLSADGFSRRIVGLLLAAVLLALWATWFCYARISLYETSTAAHLEVSALDSSTGEPVKALVGGQLAMVHRGLGQAVQLGDALFELDTPSGRLLLPAPVSGQIGALADLKIGAH